MKHSRVADAVPGGDVALHPSHVIRARVDQLTMLPSVPPQENATKLRKADREDGRGRAWRQKLRQLNQQVVALEEDERALEVVYPQVTRTA